MADNDLQLSSNLRKLLDERMKERGLKPSTAHKVLSVIFQESKAEQKLAIVEHLQEEALED